MSYLEGWAFDPITAFVTLLFAPAVVLVIAILRRAIKDRAQYAIEAVLYWATRTFTHSIAAVFTLRRYCRLALANEKLSHLRFHQG